MPMAWRLALDFVSFLFAVCVGIALYKWAEWAWWSTLVGIVLFLALPFVDKPSSWMASD